MSLYNFAQRHNDDLRRILHCPFPYFTICQLYNLEPTDSSFPLDPLLFPLHKVATSVQPNSPTAPQPRCPHVSFPFPFPPVVNPFSIPSTPVLPISLSENLCFKSCSFQLCCLPSVGFHVPSEVSGRGSVLDCLERAGKSADWFRTLRR